MYAQNDIKAYRIKPTELGLRKDEKTPIQHIIYDNKKMVYLVTPTAIVIVPINKILN